MKRGGGKAKGSSFERVVCKQLSLWVSGGKRADLFWRSAMSGGRATVSRKKGVHVHQAGDIASVHGEGHAFTNEVYVECKHLAKISLDSLATETGPLLAIWKATRTLARKMGRHPVLIMKQNRMPVLLVTDGGGSAKLCREVMPVVIAPNHRLHAFKFEDVLASRYQDLC